MAKRHNPNPNRPKHHDDDDAFVAGVLDAGTWAKKNQSRLTAGIVALVVVLAGAWYWLNYSSSLEDRALVELEQIQNTLSLGDAETSKVALAQFLEAFGGTAVGDEARLTLAQLYLETDQAGQALATLAGGGGINSPLGPQIFTLRARAFEAQDRLDEAEEAYLDVADAVDISFLKQQALSDAARIRASQGDAQGAIALYDRILADLEVSDPTRGEFEMRKAELETAMIG